MENRQKEKTLPGAGGQTKEPGKDVAVDGKQSTEKDGHNSEFSYRTYRQNYTHRVIRDCQHHKHQRRGCLPGPTMHKINENWQSDRNEYSKYGANQGSERTWKESAMERKSHVKVPTLSQEAIEIKEKTLYS